MANFVCRCFVRLIFGYGFPLKGTLCRIKPNLVFLEAVDETLQIDEVIFSLFRLGDHVVNVDLNLLVHHVVKERDHSPLIGCPNVFEIEGYDLITKGALHCDESCLGLVLFGHPDLIIPRETVHERELRVACGFVDQDVDVGHNVRHPFRVVADLQETRINLVDDLLFDAEEKAGSLPLQVLPFGREFFHVEQEEVLDYSGV
ncbi:hypothetical protein CRG98_037752 [Punica granatum]|uniref:Uncharacterized protein n=1 Tax=Punica granatum TaxID=22663 RepID=A0A2I0ICY0_PUNGR|nr:hypothetical protein CRG98_037752 [Punica granatum]